MQVLRNGSPAAVGRSEWFTGPVHADTVAAPAGPSRLRAASVHLALQQVDDRGSAATWGAHVSDDEYGEAPSVEAAARLGPSSDTRAEGAGGDAGARVRVRRPARTTVDPLPTPRGEPDEG